MKLFRGERVLLPDGQLQPACITVQGDKIVNISTGFDSVNPENFELVVDAGQYVLMPGVVDAHVHVNEPGRTDWETYDNATRAAAAGGITTIIDMPLNSIPSTTSLEAFQEKLRATEGKLHVDVGFWGGVVPGNVDELGPMLNAGVVGFKCFMINSGVEEFQHVDEQDIRGALQKLQGTEGVLLFHAELDCVKTPSSGDVSDVSSYETFLASRPDEMEVKAIRLVCQLCEEYKVPCHIVHLSTAQALEEIRECKKRGAPLSVETTHHYLSLSAEEVPRKATQYKCCPPIRSKANQELLWEAVLSGLIDMVVSDHSPCTADLKLLDKGDFMSAWGGISSVQFGLSLLWTHGQSRSITIPQLSNLLSRHTAKLCGMSSRKGCIKEGYDADFVIWDPEASFTVETDMIQHKNKVTPYLGATLRGVVKKTVVRGQTVYEEGAFHCNKGSPLLTKQ